MEFAKRYASSAEDHVLRLKHLLAALLDVDATILRKLLARDNLVRPENLDFEQVTPPEEIVISSQVNRILSLHGGRMENVAKALGAGTEIGLPHLAAAMVVKPRGIVLEMLQLNTFAANDSAYTDAVMARAQNLADEERRIALEAARAERMASLRKIKHELAASCHGQRDAVNALIAHVATATGETPSERAFRPITLAFIGGPGTGKTMMATKFRDGWAHLFKTGKPAVLDMSRFAVEQLITDICGRDPCWKDGGKPGALTRLAAENPRGVIIIENIDKAHPGALVPICNMLTDGKLTDEFTGEEVSFAENIVILATNQGTSYIDSGKFAHLCSSNGGTIPRDKLVEGVIAALEEDAPSKAGVLGEILSKVDVPIPFKRHDAISMAEIVSDAIDRTLQRMNKIFDADISADRESLVKFFLETLEKLDSAHGVGQNVENVLLTHLEDEILNSGDSPAFKRSKISITVDPLPEIDITSGPTSGDERTMLAARTRSRIRQAKHLDYDVNVSSAGDETTIHITNLRHTVMPSIEDAGWFSVCPPDVHPEDLVGLETAWTRVRNFIAHTETSGSGAIKPNHILLWGPPGTGKTAFAKAIARSLDRSFICVNAARFTTSANDNRAVAWIQELFATAERTESIIFIDECDAIGSRDKSLPTQAPVINTLLTLLDGFEENHVMVIGATNRPEMLDSALTRPGRLHTRIKVDVLRKSTDRSKLIDIFCRKSSRSLPSNMKELVVSATDGWAPANILSVLRETFAIAGESEPTPRAFAQARNLEFAGDETQRPQLTDEEKLHVATHEAGHALAATLHGHRWLQVTITGCDNSLGFLEHLKEGSVGWSMKTLQEKIDVALAGNAAERILGTVSEGSESDFSTATEYARRIVRGGFCDGDELAVTPGFAEGEHGWERIRPRVNAILKERMDAVMELLTDNKNVLKYIAEELVRRGTLFPEDVSSAIRLKTGRLAR